MDWEALAGAAILWIGREVWGWLNTKKQGKTIVKAATTAKRAIEKGSTAEAKEALQDTIDIVNKEKERIKDLRKKYGRDQ